MMRSLPIAAAVLLSTTQVVASPQTHELISCARIPTQPSRGIICTGVDDDDGYRLIAVQNLSNGNSVYWLERPIAP